MNSKSLRVVVLAAAFSVSASLSLAAPSVASDTSGAATTISASSQSAAVSHWTAKRLSNALPGDQLLLGRTLSDVAGKVAVGLPQIISGRQGTSQQASLLGGLLGGGGGTNGGLYASGGRVVKTTGKVFFTLDNIDYQCSGSSVKAKNKDLVVTAGHCVNAGPGAFATNFIFIPAYHAGSAPFGKFAARKLTTTTQFKNKGDLNYDVGLAVVNTVGGKHLADVVGSQGIAFNQPRKQLVYSFGYPAAPPYDGTSLASCQGTTIDDTQGSADEGLDCNMTGGSSGGPWYLNFNPSTGVGLTNSVNSFKYTGGGFLGLGGDTHMYGPYFGSVIQSVYKATQGL